MRFGRARRNPPSKEIVFQILRETNIDPVGAVNMRERLSTDSQFDIILAMVMSLNTGNQEHFSSQNFQESHGSPCARARVGLIPFQISSHFSTVSGSSSSRIPKLFQFVQSQSLSGPSSTKFLEGPKLGPSHPS